MAGSQGRRTLQETANEQGSYFTAKQAQDAGYGYRLQHYHVQAGNWERVGRGLFRLAGYPQPDRPDLIVLTLASHSREGRPQAVVSHESALDIHDISDANPTRNHLTVPPGFRKRMPDGVILHRARLDEAETEDRGGYFVTLPLRTIIDVADGFLDQEILEGAIRDALDSGLIRERKLVDAPMSARARGRISAALQNIYREGQ